MDKNIERSMVYRYFPIFVLQCIGVLCDNLALESDPFQSQSLLLNPHSSCRTEYEHVSVVKQVPSFSKHCTMVDETKCKTIFKNSFSTAMETQCSPTFDTSCDTTLQTAYKQDCKIIKDVECRIVNLEDTHGGHTSKKICEDVPSEKCVPVPVKVEGQKCVNVPTQSCETVPVTANNPVPKKQCFKKPRKVCQTLVSTKPKVVTAKIPREVCDHRVHIAKKDQSHQSTIKVPSMIVKKPSLGMKKLIKPSQQIQSSDLLKMEQLYNKEYAIRRADTGGEESEARSFVDIGNENMDEEGMVVDENEAKHLL